jgi:hypothetical protein
MKLANIFQQLAHGFWAHSDDQQIGQFDCFGQTLFHDDAMLPLEFSQLSRVPIMYHDAAIVSCEPQSRHERARNPASTDKNCGPH